MVWWINTHDLVDQHNGFVDQHNGLVDQHKWFCVLTHWFGGSTHGLVVNVIVNDMMIE